MFKIIAKAPNAFDVEVYQWKAKPEGGEGNVRIATLEIHAVDNRIHINRREDNFAEVKIHVDQFHDKSYVLNNTNMSFETSTLDIIIEKEARLDNSAICGVADCKMPNQCRIDNGYTKRCKDCLCRNCVKSDCFPTVVKK